ncbi:MAG TPA: LysM peptidoglycan-binding domain-containing protein [Symbiobacteriaceae bacterium]|nr:LysM peptidoglycan-binding domain-containing protein [Symbiobacteriaceae bacterium]
MQASVMQPCGVHLVRRTSSKRQRRARTIKALAVILLALLFLFVAPRAVEMMSRSTAPVTESYTVAHGDTLWDIAARYAGSSDVRKAVAAIKRVNGLETATVHPGQELMIPKLK